MAINKVKEEQIVPEILELTDESQTTALSVMYASEYVNGKTLIIRTHSIVIFGDNFSMLYPLSRSNQEMDSIYIRMMTYARKIITSATLALFLR